MSRSLLGCLFIRYSLSPVRKYLRVTTTSSNSESSLFSGSELSKVTETSAKPIGRLSSVPPKITSSIFVPRILRLESSPRTQRIASEIFDFPLPLGPTITVAPRSNERTVLFGKDLKPWSSRDFKYILFPLFYINRECLYSVRLQKVDA